MLKQIANAMRDYAEENPFVRDAIADIGCYQRKLSGGAIVTLTNDKKYWRLSITRKDVHPSETEVATFSRSFNVPNHAERMDGIIATYFIVRFRWLIEPDQLDLFGDDSLLDDSHSNAYMHKES